MRGSSGHWISAACAVGLACCAGWSGASADTYRSGNYAFEVDGLPLDSVQEEVLSAIRLPLTTRGVEQVARWSATPCYNVGNAHGYVGEDTLTGVIAQLNLRLPYRIEPCLARERPAITYYLVGSALDPADRRELTKRLLPPADMECDWNRTAADRDSGLLTHALVVARSTASSTRQTIDCLMRNTVEALGVGWYESRKWNDPGALTKSDERELNLLALFVRYRITQELHTFKTLFQVEDRIAALVAEMHEAGTLAQSE